MIRVLIVDDEEPARSKLRTLLADDDELEVVGEAADGETAVEAIGAKTPDLVFLDIQMPKADGFEVVRQIGLAAMPLTVFVTAFDEHAVEAFEVQAIDYLLKPFARGRLQRAVKQVKERLAAGSRADHQARLERLLENASPPPRYLEHLLVSKAPHREVLLPVTQIDVLRAAGNHVELVTTDGTFRCKGPLASLESRLDPDRFLRANRSEIVRLEAVHEFQPWFRGDYRIILAHGEVLSWSRRYRALRKHEFEAGRPSKL